MASAPEFTLMNEKLSELRIPMYRDEKSQRDGVSLAPVR